MMEFNNISFTTECNLCCGCGICVGICPSNCIDWEKSDNGLYQPIIDTDRCIDCGLCQKVCPGLGHQYEKDTEWNAVKGNVLLACNAWSLSPAIRHVSASGGVVSSLIQHLLENDSYDIAFLVDSYNYKHQLRAIPVTTQNMHDDTDFSSYPKSRYLPVSHEDAVAYVKSNSTKKVIIVGISCAIRGFLAAIEQMHLSRDNYLLLGLFCDRVFTYNVIDYYSQPAFCGDKKLEELHFKNKENGGWPGNMKFLFSDGSTSYRDKSERIKVKDYFVPERCLYCIDKLNVCADISFGDNYTQQNSSPLGSNSVIIRTELGLAVWRENEAILESHNISVDQIMKAQIMDQRLNNLCYGKLKEQEILKRSGQKIVLNKGICIKKDCSEYYGLWQKKLQMMHLGEQYASQPKEMQRKIEKMERKKKRRLVIQAISKVCHLAKRR